MMKNVGWPDGYAKCILPEVDSTNAEAVRVAATLTGPTWIMAHRQTAGRGRRGRPWVDPTGNLAATLVLRPAEVPGQAALRSFVAALALDDALVMVTGRAESFALKWPNDVLLHGGKLAGILLESAGIGGKLSHLAIGFGVNLSEVPQVVAKGAVPPVSLRGETGTQIAPEDFLTYLAAAYAMREDQFARHGFAPIRTAWLARAARLGEVITARTGKAEITGRFETVDEDGNLVLSTGTGRQAIAAADVFFDEVEAGHAAGD
ncbi:biotin--[acetyl-CoA-carboxylase] ligase [Roseovarius pelagicus]|uniref:biotin--[biotin carboxyl-carrier protein] ligase n=1 Tax=Roseovarius pelagicus TaxID=2980108 RepID=A0ABY6DG86_9RHOB|nr:biotin--[acetyl-CoA-carboxylase] ligase [Roseovarius pelagicus]UXX83953.1 biotin--[acetyl-CoA-carboxylase] ligase [Roseovarius pelagicus]